MKTFRIKSGKHHEPDKTYKVGDVFKSELELAKLFPSKFERVHSNVTETAVPKSVDATEKFPIAIEADVTVVRRGKDKFFVMDGEDQLNDRPLKESNVHTYIDRMLAVEQSTEE